MDFSSYKTWEKIVVVVIAVPFLIYLFTPSCDNSPQYYSDESSYVEDDCYYEFEDGIQTEPRKNIQSDNKPRWIYGSWHSPLADGMGALIVFLDDDYASVKIMNGFTLVSNINYDGWTIFNDYDGDYVYLYNDGDRMSDSPHFRIDYSRQRLLTNDYQYMEKH